MRVCVCPPYVDMRGARPEALALGSLLHDTTCVKGEYRAEKLMPRQWSAARRACVRLVPPDFVQNATLNGVERKEEWNMPGQRVENGEVLLTSYLGVCARTEYSMQEIC